jgi:hypothetical protein
MPRLLLAAVAALLAVPAVEACTFCAGGVRSRQSLRGHLAQAKYVAYGTLKNARVDPNGVSGTTDFHVTRVVKSYEPFAKLTHFVVPKYIPAGGGPSDYLFFVGDRDGTPDPFHGVPATLAMSEYVTAIARLGDATTNQRLAFYFGHLDADDPSVSADAFLEFAKATDVEIAAAKPVLDAGKLRRLLTKADTPADRLGVYAMMLGLCGGPTDADLLDAQVSLSPMPERVQDSLGGHLAGLAALDIDRGWKRITSVITDPARQYAERLAAIGTLRYLQGTRGDTVRPQVVACYKTLMTQPDLADLAIEDLRRWGYFDATPEVLALFDKPTHAGRLVRRAIVQYALTAPGDAAKAFVTKLRTTDPKLVASAEELLKLQK